MIYRTYVPKKFKPSSKVKIAMAKKIILDYAGQGFELTLRQLYYQFVARDLIPNSQREYKNLGSIINDARLAGDLPWDAIVDRTRSLRANSHWTSPASIMQGAARSYAIDKWEGQPTRIEVWIEKDALVGVISDVCDLLDVPYFSCRGYTSQSEMWNAAQRLIGYEQDGGQETVILHLGDHDPSGIDMTRDIQDRLRLFGAETEVRRIALNRDQIDRYDPPPNPAKTTDARAADYVAEHGPNSWELDALEPRVLIDLVREEVFGERDRAFWDEKIEEEDEDRKRLTAIADNWDDLESHVNDLVREAEKEDEE